MPVTEKADHQGITRMGPSDHSMYEYSPAGKPRSSSALSMSTAVRVDGEVDGRLELAGVGHPARVRVADLLDALERSPSGEVEGRAGEDLGMVHADEARRGVHERLVGAVPVEEEHAPEAVASERAADVLAVARERVPADRDRSREVHVMGGVAVGDNRQEHDLVRCRLGCAPAYLPGDSDVRVDREMGPVILQGRDRDEANALLTGRETDLGPGQALVEERATPHRAMVPRPRRPTTRATRRG